MYIQTYKYRHIHSNPEKGGGTRKAAEEVIWDDCKCALRPQSRPHKGACFPEPPHQKIVSFT